MGQERTVSVKVILAAIVLLTALSFSPALTGDYLWDDDEAVRDNVLLHSPQGLRAIWTRPDLIPQQHYWPLVYTTFWIEYQLWGLNPIGYHAVNIALHLLNVLLVAWLLRRLRVPGALLATALFALHPIHVESVAWIVERKDVLSALFYLIGAAAFLIYRERGSMGTLILALVAFVGAMLSKSIAVTLPVALLIIVWWQHGRVTRRDLISVAPFLVIGAGIALFDVLISRSMVRSSDLTLIERLFLAPRIAGFYLWKLVLPINLTAIYPLWETRVGATGMTALLGGGALLVGGALRARAGHRGLLAALVFFLVTLAPLLGWVDFEYMVHSFVADRYVYLASLGPLVLLAAGAIAVRDRLRPGRVPAALAGVALCGLLAALTAMNTTRFRSMTALFEDVLEANPDSYVAHQNLGSERMQAGDLAGAERHLREAVRLAPGNGLVQHGLGTVLLLSDQPAEAAIALQRAVELRPDLTDARVNLGAAWVQTGRPKAGALELERALESRPGDPEITANLSQAWVAAAGDALHRGELAEAEPLLVRAGVLRDRDPALWEALGRTRVRLGDRDGARKAFERSLALAPPNPGTLIEMAWLLAVPGPGGESDPARALEMSEVAAQAAPVPTPAVILEVQAAALAAAGRYPDALETLDRALGAPATPGDPDLSARVRAARARYAAGAVPVDDRFQ